MADILFDYKNNHTQHKLFKMKTFQFLLILATITLFTQCKSEGCTDPKAKNFSYEADKDDGSCDYGGCTDEDALNFDADAQYDDNTCLYNGGLHFITTRNSLGGGVFLSVEVNNGYIGSLAQKCTAQFPTCETNCAHLKYTDQAEGFYNVQYWQIRQTSSTTFDTLFASPVEAAQVIGGECNIYVLK